MNADRQYLNVPAEEAGPRRGDAAQAFLFFSLFVNVSYFVQLQSWSLKEGKTPSQNVESTKL